MRVAAPVTPRAARALAAGALCVGVLCAGALCTSARAATQTTTTPSGSTTTPTPPLEKSTELWATVDLCNTKQHPDTIGVRGSMPTDGHAQDTMYMRFRIEALDASTHEWVEIGKRADSGFVQIGSAASTRQAGRSFEFQPGGTTYTLRGLVEFQWRRHGKTVHTATRTTTSGHTSLAGAEPKGFSTATCSLS